VKVVFIVSTKVSLQDKIREIGGRPFSPVEVARTNDQVVRMSLCDGEFHWHKHANEESCSLSTGEALKFSSETVRMWF